MPGQRAKNKVPFGGFIDRKLHRKIIAAADKAGWRDNRFGFFLDLLTPIIEHRYRRLKPRQRKPPTPRSALRTRHLAAPATRRKPSARPRKK